MVSIPRLLSIWFALHLSVGIGLMGLASAFLERPGAALGAPLVIGVVGALLVAIILIRSYPELENRVVWRFGLLTSVLFVVGNVVVSDGIYAPPGEGSVLTTGLLWFAAMGVAYGLVGGWGDGWVETRLDDR